MDDKQQELMDAIISIFSNATELSLKLDCDEMDEQKNTHSQEDE